MAGFVLSQISKSFGTTNVLTDISLQAADGEFVVLLGPSGCGKSTLLRIIAGLEAQTSGSVSIGERVVDSLPPRDRDIAMVFQQYALYPHLTVRDNLAFGLKMRKESPMVIEERIAEAAELLEIHELLDRKPKELSGGQRQRVAMGRAIVRKPKLFLFDEPLSNLDARLRASMRVELKKLHQRLGVTMVYVTHDQVEAMTLGQTIVIMDQGIIQQIGTPDQIYHHSINPFVAAFIGNPPMNLLSGSVRLEGQKLEFHAGDFSLTLDTPSPLTTSLQSDQATLGIRPEDITFNFPGDPHFSMSSTIDMIENLGGDHIVYLLAQGQHLTARASPTLGRQAGDSITAHVPLAKVHLFINQVRIPLELFRS
ncbi:sn-glycerol-3-phosphate ABC transporter ATP-binding protein UgpC [Candidatus Nitronereus thalassa]|uniref:Sn-glycerol-3-phosphate ABC transporter ATP-binding protein UgpC n=1 Tax=Candidatus Nitronereus thalassa TaxID=3020898 RepID=A0ABU3K3N5_9BACT|nr:sn-glycerol-3-phosphate ABC transporter ATP-binding protein UgpC [Candidatus Nitronereus thalassa]MDT7041025.1 sn-glycerol-3-phosphate ABC transporter ATP-binding protein UgpC [Candidatus Nitronereus thalassa]